ncbi:MAG TPA: Gfo/Idh/MocA family oxidoreductase [Solirubrobacteraceae bacterium]|nr:Gfo/Idh/MocA family oxidoreductase [Solirubrobacteraceae bacterium]
MTLTDGSSSGERRLRTAVVGYGYWGPNLVRNVIERPELEFAGLCERDPERAAAFAAKNAGASVFPDLAELLDDPLLDAVLVATPPHTHHPIVRAALEAGKHVLVEKPLATRSQDAYELLEVAELQGLVLMPGHTFLYSPPVNKVKQLIVDDIVGEVYFVTSARMNLGKYQSDGVICDLAPHDLSILLYWLDEPVAQVAATGRSVFQPEVFETAFLTVTFESGATANIQISWLSPRKIRDMTLVGSRRMVQYDDTGADEAVRVFDRGLDFVQPTTFGEHQLAYRSGDIVIPRLEATEPLAQELKDFATAIRTGATPRSNAELGIEVVLAMEAAEESLRHGGKPIAVARRALRAA